MGTYNERCVDEPNLYKLLFYKMNGPENAAEIAGLRKICYRRRGRRQTPALFGQLSVGSACSIDDYADQPILLPRPFSYMTGPDGLEKYLAYSPINDIGNFVNSGDFD